MNKLCFLAGMVLLLFIPSAVRPLKALDPRQEGYPPPAVATTLPPAEDAFQELNAADPYPATGTDAGAFTPIPIGIQSGAPEAQGNASANGNAAGGEANSRGLVFLWLGFTATFLVFLTSVVGSILLFTRRNES
ncbi:MAG: hypothetical protein KA586_04525 [Candidatus Promineofilum sp.]|nr:hypothetical protein [Promineifilum sp.]